MTSRSRQLAVLASCWIMFAGCSARRPVLGGTRPQSDSAVVHALLGQVYGLGGCTSISAIDLVQQPFFRNLDLLKGRCSTEHDDFEQTSAYAVRDLQGNVFVLGSLSAFEYLRLRHPPAIDSAHVLEYGELAVKLIGCWHRVPPSGMPPPNADAEPLVLGSRLTGCWPSRGTILRNASVVEIRGLVRTKLLPEVRQQGGSWQVTFVVVAPGLSIRFDIRIGRDGRIWALTGEWTTPEAHRN